MRRGISNTKYENTILNLHKLKNKTMKKKSQIKIQKFKNRYTKKPPKIFNEKISQI